jgi:hypothetical protein
LTGFEVEVVGAASLDYEAWCRLQRSAFAAFLEERGASDRFITPEFFRWKYSPPAGEAQIALVRDGDRIVAGNAMYPVIIHRGSSSLKGWQSCDTATVPEARRQGLFGSCLRALVAALGDDEVFFGFPNQNSMRGFRKLGWTENEVVTSWITPLPVPSLGAHGEVARVKRFVSAVDTIAERLGAEGFAMLDRSAAYLNWRYADRPFADYTLLVHDEHGEIGGFAVVCRAPALGRMVTLVMELWAASATANRALLRAIRTWAWRARAPFLAMLSTGRARRPGVAAGFLRVPSRLVPKRQVLMGMGTGNRSEALMKGPWSVQTGDWDAF